ncbi:MAG: hypothetical protein QW339_00640, partial [Sulfolobales archaeon]
MTFYREALLGESKDRIVSFISSMDEDRLIVKEVIEVLIAHVDHLRSKGLIPYEVGGRALEVLKELLKNSDEL